MPIVYDPTGISAANLITAEVHTPVAEPDIWPVNGTFYSQGLSVSGVDAVSGLTVPLLQFQDYVFSPQYLTLSDNTGLEVYSYILLLNYKQWSAINITYQATGGDIDYNLASVISQAGTFDRTNIDIWLSFAGSVTILGDRGVDFDLSNQGVVFQFGNKMSSIAKALDAPSAYIDFINNQITALQQSLLNVQNQLTSFNSSLVNSGVLSGTFNAGTLVGATGPTGGLGPTGAAAVSIKNRVINGACNVVQWPVKVTGDGTNWSGPDRYMIGLQGSGGSLTQNQHTLTYNGVSKNTVRQTVNVAPTAPWGALNFWQGIVHVIEGYNCYDFLGQAISISFIFNTNIAGNYSVSLRDGSPATHSFLHTFNVPTANIPQLVTFTTIVPASANLPISNMGGLGINIGAIQGGNYMSATINSWLNGNFIALNTNTDWSVNIGNFIEISELQIELGTVPTPFDYRNSALEFAACQRYFQTVKVYRYLFGLPAAQYGSITQRFGVPMRTVPSSWNTGTPGLSGGVSQGPHNGAPYSNEAFLIEAYLNGAIVGEINSGTQVFYYNAELII